MAYAFDAAGTRLEGPVLTLGPLVSVVAWIKPSGWGQSLHGVIWQQGATNDNNARFNVRVENTNPLQTFSCGRAGSTDWQWSAPANSITLNQWAHVGVASDGAAGTQLYKNGLPVTTTTISGAGAMIADGLVYGIGARPGVNQRVYGGLIAMVAVWTRTLSASEMQRVYWNGPAAALRALLMWYTWNEANLLDYSGNGRPMVTAGTAPTFTAEMPPRLSLVAA